MFHRCDQIETAPPEEAHAREPGKEINPRADRHTARTKAATLASTPAFGMPITLSRQGTEGEGRRGMRDIRISYRCFLLPLHHFAGKVHAFSERVEGVVLLCNSGGLALPYIKHNTPINSYSYEVICWICALTGLRRRTMRSQLLYTNTKWHSWQLFSVCNYC